MLRLSLCVLAVGCAAGRPERSPSSIENTVRRPASSTCMSMSFAGERHLKMRLATDENEYGVSVFEPEVGGAVFPTVSSDGTTLVELFDETDDDRPASSLMFWSTATGQRTDVFRPGLNDQTTLDDANARLARSTWRGVATCTPPGDGVTSLDTAFGRIELYPDRRALRVGDTRVQLELPGAVPHFAGERCGSYRGIERAYGAGALVVVTLQATIAGEGCVGLRSSELAVTLAR